MKTPLLTDADFKQKTQSGTMLIDFMAEWCQPCKAMAAIIDEIAAEMPGRVFKVDVDKSPMTARATGVRGLPTFAIMVDGNVVATKTGQMTKKSLKAWIETTVA